ncbi:RNA polymerase sigma-70 factor [Muricauda sp. SCSIO 64092]|uniref:RNA polymerase sigma factor n=1 Tax=Allomuricauda sp. SCSIO 64092 TaxID=2908842 RepID=UPI001FF53C93|nr:RNA polymerase sigma-70 factor [Muricauda sp. SCSIO 64092]UOY08300.1 RNA polymerase sigma-70 factor [Muricauda sp. SCSIO 64092]
MDCETLRERIRAGDRKAFRSLFDDTYDSLLAYTTTFTHDRESAKDIVQQCFTNLWVKRNNLGKVSSLRKYLFTMAHNLFIDQYRKEQSRHQLYDELKIQALSDRVHESGAEANKRTKKLIAIIEELPPKCKEILLLNKREGKKYHEIAAQLQISIKTVESQMRIAYKKIREGFSKAPLFLFFNRFSVKILKHGC